MSKTPYNILPFKYDNKPSPIAETETQIQIPLTTKAEETPEGWLSQEMMTTVVVTVLAGVMLVLISAAAAWLVSTLEQLQMVGRSRRFTKQSIMPLVYVAETDSDGTSEASSTSEYSDSDDSPTGSSSDESGDSNTESEDHIQEDEASSCSSSNDSSSTGSGESNESSVESRSGEESVSSSSSEDSDDPLLEATTDAVIEEVTEKGISRSARYSQPRLLVRMGRAVTYRWERERRRQYIPL